MNLWNLTKSTSILNEFMDHASVVTTNSKVITSVVKKCDNDLNGKIDVYDCNNLFTSEHGLTKILT